MVVLVAVDLDGLGEGLVERRVEVEHLIIELHGLVEVADLAGRDDGGGVQVLGLLLLVVDLARELDDDLDELAPVFSSL